MMQQSVSGLRRNDLAGLFASVLALSAFAAPLAGAEAPKPERISLWAGSSPTSKAAITVHRPVNGNGAAVVICPGGGYGGLVTGAEGHGIARWLNDQGLLGSCWSMNFPKGGHWFRYTMPNAQFA